MRALVLTLLAASLPAQSIATLRAQLQDEDPAKVAWAAYHAGKEGKKELIPDLRKALTTLAPAKVHSEFEHEFLARSLLDALIRLGDAPPAQLTGPFSKRFETMTLVLAARDPKAHAGLLMRRLQGRPSNATWHATCNLLLQSAPTMLAPHLARRASTELEVFVISESSCGIGLGGSASFSSACGSMKRPKDFPPTARYTLHSSKRAGARLLAKGPVPAFVLRTERKEEEFGVGRSGSPIDEADYGLLLLHTMAGLPPGQRTVTSGRDIEVVWKSAAAFETEVADAVSEIQAEFDELLQQLVRARVLSKASAEQFDVAVTYRVRDRRDETDKRTPLPKLTR